MKRLLFVLVFVIIVLFSACGKKGNNISNQYVDLDNLDTEERLSISLDGFILSDSSYNSRSTGNGLMRVGYDKYSFYCIDSMIGFKLDFSTGILGEYCDVPGCIHSINSKGCKYKTEIAAKTNTVDGWYEFISDTLYYTENGGQRKSIYKNTYYNEYNEKYSQKPEDKTYIGGIIKGNSAYITGGYWIQMLSLDTLETTVPIDIEGDGIMLSDVVGDFWFVVNQNLELIRYNLLNGESQKMGDKVWGVMCTDEYVYYVVESDNRNIYRMSVDGTGESELIIKDASAQFYVSDSHIFYAVYGDGRMCGGIYICDIDGQNPQKIELSFAYKDGTEYKVENQSLNSYIFTSSPSIDYLFIIDNEKYSGEMNENALFIVDKETGEVISVSLGIFYQDTSDPEVFDEGHILTY